MSQQSRRHNPYPWTWEIPLGIVLVILMVLVCGVHLGRGIANVWAGAGWAFPRRVELFRSLPAVLRGDAAAGLDGLNGPVSSPSRGHAAGHRRVAVEAGSGPLGTGAAAWHGFSR
jgi:hypothetical protein